MTPPAALHHIAFYRFVTLPDPDAVAARLRQLAHGLTGSILVAEEGINGVLAGAAAALDAFECALRDDPAFERRFAAIVCKRSGCTTPPFHRLKVHRKQEIVALGAPPRSGSDNGSGGAIDVNPAEWRRLLAADDVVLIDNRNSFEYRLGRFKGAIDPQVAHFRDFPAYLAAQAPAWKAAGKRVVVLDWEPNMGKLISGIGAQPVPADFSTYAGKFNNGQADIIAAPAMGWKPMELAKGVGSKGGVIRFPLLQATAAVVLRRDKVQPKIPDLDARLTQLRKFGLQYIDGLFNMLKAAEGDIPKNLWIDLPQAEQEKYYQMLTEARKVLTRQGVYDPVMMSLLKRARCKNVPSAAECGNFDE